MDISNLIDCLKLKIVLSGDSFDGLLGFNTVVLSSGKKSFPLDIERTNGFVVQKNTKTTIGTYVLKCDFLNCIDELKSIFGDDYQYESLEELLTSQNAFGLIDLTLDDEFKESIVNIGRIKAMYLTSTIDENLIVPVKHISELEL